MDKDTLKAIVEALFAMLAESIKNPLLRKAVEMLGELITAAFLSRLLKRLKDKGVVALLVALPLLMPTAALAADADAQARAALALGLALQRPAPKPAPAPAKPMPPAPAKVEKTCPCSALCTCSCNAGGVCICGNPRVLTAPAWTPGTIYQVLPARYATPAGCGPRG